MIESLPSRRIGAILALAVLCLSAVVLAAGAPADADSHVAIEEAGVEQARGDVATFTLSVPQGESATFVLYRSGDRLQQLTVTDESGDGRIAVSINTYLAGPDATASDVYSVAGRDALSVVGNDANGRLEATNYRVEAYGNGTAGKPADTAGLSIVDPGLANATVMIAPTGERRALSSQEAVHRAQREGWLTRSDALTTGDTFVLRLTAPGIAGAVANESGPTDEARFGQLLARPNTSIQLIEKYPSPSRDRLNLSLDAANMTTVVAAPANDTYYVAADLTAIPGTYLQDDSYVPRLVVDDEHRLNPGDIVEPNRDGEFEVVEPGARVTFPVETADGFPVGPTSDQLLAGWTTLAPGSTMTIRLSGGSGEPFPVTETVRVTQETPPGVESGLYRFQTTVDLTGATPESSFDIGLRTNGSLIDEYGGKFDGYVDPAIATTAAPTRAPTSTATAVPAGTEMPTATEAPTATEPATETPNVDPAVTPEDTETPIATAGTTSGDGPGFGASAAVLGVLGAILLAVQFSGGPRR